MRVTIGISALVVLASTAVAVARPVDYQVKSDVPAGQKPSLKIVAAEPVSAIQLTVTRTEDGKQFIAKHGALAKGASATLALGDGAAGKGTYKGTITLQVGGKSWSEELTFETIVRGGTSVTYDADHIDLDKRVLQFKLARPAAKADLVVITDDGKESGKGTATFTGKDPVDTWLSISWTQPTGTRVMMLKLRVVGVDGVATNVELIPWSVTIDHEDVNFDTDSAVIAATETAKLDASLAKIADAIKRSEKYMKMKLYIAGHTDTVGPTAKNQKLSFDRAAAIARYFKKQGVTVPIVVAGFGESVLKVKTADNTDERANRRADYVLGPAAGAPPFKGPYLKVATAWKQLK